MRTTKDCPECRLTAHRGRCAFCAGSGSIPLCPPVGEPVVYYLEDGDATPMTVVDSERRGRDHPLNRHGETLVSADGWLVTASMLIRGVPGPSNKPGHWNWRGDPS